MVNTKGLSSAAIQRPPRCWCQSGLEVQACRKRLITPSPPKLGCQTCSSFVSAGKSRRAGSCHSLPASFQNRNTCHSQHSLMMYLNAVIQPAFAPGKEESDEISAFVSTYTKGEGEEQKEGRDANEVVCMLTIAGPGQATHNAQWQVTLHSTPHSHARPFSPQYSDCYIV